MPLCFFLSAYYSGFARNRYTSRVLSIRTAAATVAELEVHGNRTGGEGEGEGEERGAPAKHLPDIVFSSAPVLTHQEDHCSPVFFVVAIASNALLDTSTASFAPVVYLLLFFLSWIQKQCS